VFEPDPRPLNDLQRSRARGYSRALVPPTASIQIEDPLVLRRDSVLRGLAQVRQAIPSVADLDPQYGARLEKSLKQRTREVADELEAAGKPLETLQWLHQGEALIAETLVVLGGAAARSAGLDGGVSALALDWLDQLSDAATLDHVSAVIPASDDFMGMLTHVVRLKLPVDGVWALSVATHEYGHFVASELKRRKDADGIPQAILPVEHLLAKTADEGEFPSLYWHGHELFADALATWVTGPVHLEYCVRYRFDPADQPHEGTHPSSARRLRMQLAVLEHLATKDVSGYLTGHHARLRDLWATRAAAVGAPPEPAAHPQLDGLHDELYWLLLKAPQLKTIRYGKPEAAQALAEADLADPDPGTTVAHVLNAAWSLRRDIEQHESDADRRAQAIAALAAKTEAAVRQVLDRG
jgi:hypothetical protein